MYPRFLSLSYCLKAANFRREPGSFNGSKLLLCLLKCLSFSAYLGAPRHTLAWETPMKKILENIRKQQKIDKHWVNIEKIVNSNTMQKTIGIQSCTMSLFICQTHTRKCTLHNTNRSETGGPSISHIRTLPSSLQHALAHALPASRGIHQYRVTVHNKYFIIW